MNKPIKFPTFALGFSTALKKAGLNSNSIARRLNEDPSFINRIANGKTGASSRLMTKFAEIPEFKEVGLTVDQMKRWKALDKYIESSEPSDGVDEFYEDCLAAGEDFSGPLTLEQTIESVVLNAAKQDRELTDDELIFLTRKALHERPEFRKAIEKYVIEGPDLQITTIELSDTD